MAQAGCFSQTPGFCFHSINVTTRRLATPPPRPLSPSAAIGWSGWWSEVLCFGFSRSMAQRSPPFPSPITVACKQGSEKTIYALVMDLSSPPPPPTPHLHPSPLCDMSATGGKTTASRQLLEDILIRTCMWLYSSSPKANQNYQVTVMHSRFINHSRQNMIKQQQQ